jgi:hypothetical protein
MPGKNKLRLELILGPLWRQNLRCNVVGLNHWEISLQRGESKLFENTDSGRAALEAYCRENGVDPTDLVNAGYA